MSKAKAQMLGEASLPLEKEASRRRVSGPETQTSPRAGRTGGLGSRAEKPSEGTQRQIAKKQPQPGRGSKSPNAAKAAPASSGGDKPAESKETGGHRNDLPLPVRDSTG